SAAARQLGTHRVALFDGADARAAVLVGGVRVEPLVQGRGTGFELGALHALRRAGDERGLGGGALHQDGGRRAGAGRARGTVEQGDELGSVPPRQDFLETVVVAALVAQVVRSDLDGLGPLAALAQQDLDAGTVLARLQFGYGPAVGSPGVGEFRPPQP